MRLSEEAFCDAARAIDGPMHMMKRELPRIPVMRSSRFLVAPQVAPQLSHCPQNHLRWRTTCDPVVQRKWSPRTVVNELGTTAGARPNH